MSKNIGERIRDLRNMREWSLRELENRTGINYSVLSRIESGKRPVTDQELNVFADLFDVSTDFLLGRIDQPYEDSLVTIIRDKKRPPYSNIGILLKSQLVSRKISDQTVIEILNINNDELQKIYQGEIAPTDRQAEKFASLLDTRKEMYLPEKSLISRKDEKDIAKKLEGILSELDNNVGLSFNGDPMDDTTRELVKAQIESNLRIAKQMARKKFTPNKYRTDNTD